MKRRDFFEKAGLGSALLVLPAIEAASGTRTAQQSGRSQGREEEEHKHDRRDDMNGPLASATVSFGQWDLTQPLDRFPNNSPRQVNNHQLIPKEVVIKAGGSVNFVISGFHHILVYGNGTKPSDINISSTIPPSQAPVPPLIDDPTNRIYRGLDPSVLPALPAAVAVPPAPQLPPQVMQDRVEVVRFPRAGRYLVICGVLPHFFDPATGEFVMYGYVRVLS
jgi:hypothetical protein